MKRIFSVSGVVATIFIGVGILGLAIHNLGNRYFWTDESSSFFTALGWPGPGGEPGGLAEINATLVTFLDPGVFHLLIRLWTELFGYSIVALRILPFIFFFVYIFGLFFWGRKLKVPLVLSAGIVGLMMLENITPYYSVELRAYSATQAAAVVLPLIALWLINQRTFHVLLIATVSSIFLASMQYATISANVATGLVLVLAAFQLRNQARSWMLWILGAIVVFVLPAIYFFTRGNPFADQKSELGHVDNLVIRFQTGSEILSTLQTNFLSLTAAPRTIFLLLIPFLLITHRLARPDFGRLKPLDLIVVIWIFVLTTVFVEAVLSIAGFLPWLVGTRWSITDISTIGLSLFALATLILSWISINTRSVAVAALVLGLVASAIGGARLWNYERQGNFDALSPLMPAFLNGEPGKALIDYWIYPDTRYWLEYSGLFPSFRETWISQRIEQTSGFVPAGAEGIEFFLNSDYDRLLLQNQQALLDSGIDLPSNITITTTITGGTPESELPFRPILLSKNS